MTPTDDTKLAELMLYISLKCENHRKFGAVKLNKLLFFSDFGAYSRYGKSITGAEYRKLELGPAPKRLVPVREHLESERAAFVRTIPTYDGKEQKRLITLRTPNIGIFSSEEIALVDSVIEMYCDDTAHEISDRSHEHPGWKYVELNDDIPYEAALLPENPLPLTPKELEAGRKLSLAAA